MAKKKPEKIWSEQERLLVKFMAIAAVPQAQIAKYFKIRKETLLADCRAELDEGLHGCDAQVVGALFKNAIKGNVSAQIFWCKTRLGWKEVNAIEHSGNITPVVNFNPKVVPPIHEHDDGEDNSPDIH